MKHTSVIEVETNSLIEEQYILSKFPYAIWVAIGEKTKFYIPYPEYAKVKKTISEWEGDDK